MPLQRSPIADAQTNLTLTAARSDPNLSARTIGKRKREEQIDKSDLEMFKTEITTMFMDLKNTMQDIKIQNTKLQESVDFTAAKYDEIIDRMKLYEENRSEDQRYIRQLEDKIENLERQGRASSLEIRNIPKPKSNPESKQDLIKIVVGIGASINVPIQKSQVKDIFRINKKGENKPIIVHFTTAPLKDDILTALKQFNRLNKENKFNTGHVKIEGPKVPIYISENLTARAKRLYFLARDFASQHQYKYCWTSYGKVFLRKDDGTQLFRIECENDINNLGKQK